jgi:4-hydroxybenzoate polyprenyltransferase
MDWPLKIAVAVFWICLVVAVVLGLCTIWGGNLSDTTGRILATAVVLGICAGFYIALRDALQRIKKG